jgi:hypothetical protein
MLAGQIERPTAHGFALQTHPATPVQQHDVGWSVNRLYTCDGAKINTGDGAKIACQVMGVVPISPGRRAPLYV